jgi:hypothetical protein
MAEWKLVKVFLEIIEATVPCFPTHFIIDLCRCFKTYPSMMAA